MTEIHTVTVETTGGGPSNVASGWPPPNTIVQVVAGTAPYTGPVPGASLTVPARPTIVCLCGSTRFSHAFREANLRETLAGRIVLSIGCDLRSDHELWADLDEAAIERIKSDLDELHKRKIDLADEILVLNVGGYIGSSTRSETDYAVQHGKAVRWLEHPDGETLSQIGGLA